jgi:ribose/xylose/arabinose/galactoside ABC-type transport system permease subunit
MSDYQVFGRPQPWKGRGLRFCVLVLIIYALVGAISVRSFLNLTNLNAVLYSASVVLPATLGMQALLILGQFDLSVGAAASLIGMVVGLSMEHTGSLGIAFLAATAVAVIAGVGNGLLATKLAISPLIATLATMGMMRSVSLVASDSRVVTGFPQFELITTDQIGPMSVLVLLSLVAVGLAEYLFRNSVALRRFYAVGENRLGADHCGIKTSRMLVLGYCLAALGAAVTGIIQTARQGSAAPQAFPDLAIECIAACMIGGSSLNGGKGTMLGAAVGATVIAATQNIVTLLNVKPEWTDLAIGLLLLFSMGFHFSPKTWRFKPRLAATDRPLGR